MAKRLADAKPNSFQVNKQNQNLLITCQRERERANLSAKTKCFDFLTVVQSLLIMTEWLLAHLLPLLGTGRAGEGVGSTV